MPQPAQEIASGYAPAGPGLELGALLWPVDAGALDAAVRSSALYERYARAVDRESAYEKLTRGAEEGTEAAGAGAPAGASAGTSAGAEVRAPEPEARGAEPDQSLVEQVVGSGVFRSLARSVGTQLGREITRSLFGTARRRR